MNPHSVTNPQSRRTNGRRKNLSKAWRSSEWKTQRSKFLLTHPVCEMHERLGEKVPAVLAHHPYITSYKNGYSDLELSQCTALCSACHCALHHGKTLCKTCRENYHPFDAEECRYCNDRHHPEIVKERERKRELFEQNQREIKKAQATKRRIAKRKHPCVFHRTNQKCTVRMLGVCDYSPRKAPTICKQYKPKKSVKK